MKMESTVTVRGQTAIPVALRRKYNIRSQTKLQWIDDGYTISVIPLPADPINALKGRVLGGNLLKALSKAREKERNRG